MFVAHGYQTGDPGIRVPDLEIVDDPTVKIKITKRNRVRDRPPVLVQAGPVIMCGNAPVVRPQPDFGDVDNVIEGAIKRFVGNVPPADKEEREKLKDYVQRWLKKNLKPLQRDHDVSFETWVEEIKHPRSRKDEFKRAKILLDEEGLSERDRFVKSFLKREQYAEYKYARVINSRTDKFKVFCGPIFHAIEKELFKLPEFIKYVPVSDRPGYIIDMLQSLRDQYVPTDYTSFESLFDAEIMDAVEFQLYEYMVQALPEGPKFIKEIRRTLAGKNHCHYDGVTVRVEARRMSGEMCTSLGNSFSNLMFFGYLCEKLGSRFRGVVEGDDGLFAVVGKVPTVDDFAHLGLKIKMSTESDLTKASFCGLVFDPDDRLVVRDPKPVLADFGWVDGRYYGATLRSARKLLRCKSLSLAHQYPGCPIIGELAQLGLRMTRGVNVKDFIDNSNALAWWDREILLGIRDKPVPYLVPPPKTRDVVAELYGIPVHEQIRIENLLKTWVDSERLPHIDSDLPEDWISFGRNYCHRQSRMKRVPFIGPSRVTRRWHGCVTVSVPLLAAIPGAT